MYQLKIHPQIFATFPDFRVAILYARNLENGASTEWTRKIQEQAENEQRKAFGEKKASDHPHIAAWREAYAHFGAKPNKFLCSVEALLKRVLKNEDLPQINALVDLYNAISVKHVLPVGGEDWDKLESDLELKFAVGGESFLTRSEGMEVTEVAEPGEVIWADQRGVTCRRWNWRQGLRTALTENTKNAYFVLESLAPYSREALERSVEELITLMKNLSPHTIIEYEILESPK